MLGARDRRCNISRGPVQAGLLGKMGVKEAEVLVELEGEAGSSCLELEKGPRCDTRLRERSLGEGVVKRRPAEGTRDTGRFLNNSDGRAVGVQLLSL